MAKRGENIYKRKDGRYEGRYIRGCGTDGKTLFGYIYAYTYGEVKKALTLAKAASRHDSRLRLIGKGTLAEYMQWWLEHIIRERVKTSTYAQYQERVFHYIIPSLGELAVCKLSREQVQYFTDSLSRKGLAASTVGNIVGLLRSALKKGINLQLLCSNPCEGVLLPAAQARGSLALDRVEQVRLELAASDAGEDAELGVFLALYAGLRIGEICALRWRDIDIHTATLTVRSTLQRIRVYKNGKPQRTVLAEGLPKSKRSLRCIPLPNDVADKLFKHSQGVPGDSYVLTGSMKPLEPRSLRARFKKIAALAKLSISFHTLRHTYATRCLEHNFDIQTLSELLGHAAASTTMAVYAHSVMEHKRMLTHRLYILSEMNAPSNEPSMTVHNNLQIPVTIMPPALSASN